ncbi:MAG: hypothetical protein CVU55_09865 [Deltaproteobacteria bacterium HGW-Deltaproteobacteria-13]|jgi:hypothetical protein|nr:MAG: hypothetical protein CVU55_09865 [Deltaproteobacteria bacterium HGW-Deltaproteobacteria-13]
MKKSYIIFIVAVFILSGAGIYIYLGFPTVRVPLTAELIMLGDLNEDNRWNKQDEEILIKFVRSPHDYSDRIAFKIDVNHNGLIDNEDILILQQLYKVENPYQAADSFNKGSEAYPRARELFKYHPRNEYLQRPVFTLPNIIPNDSPLSFLSGIINDSYSPYQLELVREIYDEAVRFSIAYEKRKDFLEPVEIEYLKGKTKLCKTLLEKGQFFNLLLEVISLTEDAETLFYNQQTPFIQKILYFRDHLRSLLKSETFREFKGGKENADKIFKQIDQYISSDLSMDLRLENLSPPRDLLKLENYADRIKWQYYKSTNKKNDFERLVLYAQYDRRYLRAVSKTTRKLTDVTVENHNLPMILLFRKALQIKNNDKLAAVGLLDEAIRIPFGWVHSIPKNLLPSSIALENFLLPGNKEDSSDKSRHWNVFGGISLYKSPEESLKIALAREVQDAKLENYSPESMREFVRDSIANINGIYYVVSMRDQKY